MRHRLTRGRVVVLAAAVWLAMAALAPREFASLSNLGNLVRAVSTDALAAAGFTLVMLVGQLDLSVGATMTLGGIVVLSLQPALGWAGAWAAAAAAGAAVGLFNGLLVTKAKVNSFIVTLGTLTILAGLTRILLQGGSKSLGDMEAGMRMADALNPVHPLSPRVLLAFLPVLLLDGLLLFTRAGRTLLLIGGNREAAWTAGVAADRYVTGAFAAGGALAALGGALTAAAQNTVMPNLGDKTLMLAVAAAIVGGTSMAGGRGSVTGTIVALFALDALTNGLSYLGAEKSVKLIASGTVLAAVVVADAWRTARRERVRGQRRELMAGLARGAETGAGDGSDDTEGRKAMERARKERNVAMVCIAAVACTAMVLIYAMGSAGRGGSGGGAAGSAAPGAPVDALALKATDGQPLVWIDTSTLQAPTRPADPATLPDDDLLRWYDNEFSGWNAKKLPMPPSPGTGPRGKRVVSLQYMDHPYWKGYGVGMRRLAAAYGMDLTILEAGNDNKVQMDQVEQVIRMRPDLVILTPVDAHGVVPMLKRLHDERLPTIASNLIPVDDGMKYVITWTGPDDWGQFRMLARELATRMGRTGGYCIVRHVAGTSCYLSRTWAVVSELKQIAPGMKCLDMQCTDLKTEETKTQVAAWIKKYGKDLKGIVSADDSKAMVGIAEALQDAGRRDVVCVSAGSSRTGLQYIQEGRLHAVTYQSAEGDGALPIEIAARWFRGEAVDRPVYYIRKAVITAGNVKEFLPAQW
jgi:ribose/xylose/arabinose/galactoside ABC-type transport system permease subunit/ABC-type sugar transport system substrate-binding protein